MAINTIDNKMIKAFKNDFNGQVILPGSSYYEKARQVWNGMIDKRPAMIAKCKNVMDVINAIRFARDNDLPVSIRGGGHNVAGYAVCDDGMVIDMANMKRVIVNPESRTVIVEAGALWQDVDPATQEFGLATPGGEVSLTGVAGLTLGGGVGYLRRKYGLTCDNLQSVDLVTADGQVLKASPKQNEELFWALRGGGGNFGVVTAFEFKLHPVGPRVATLNPIYPISESRKVLDAWREFTATAPDASSTAFAVWGIPDHPDMPQELIDTPVCLLDGMYADDPEAGESLFNPLREISEPIMDMSGRPTYLEVQTGFDAFMKDGDLYYWKSLFLDTLSNEVVNTMLSWIDHRPNPRILVIIRHMGGAIARVGEADTAYVNRKANYMLSIDGAWTDHRYTERNISWIRDFWKAMNRFSNGGVYVNFPGFGESDQALWQASYGDNYHRLSAVKRQYDPGNVFRMNQNIPPTEVNA